MSSIQVECSNCGLTFQVKIDKVATARCGNCQQALARVAAHTLNSVSLNTGQGQQKRKTQGKSVKIIIGLPIIMILAIPAPLVASLVISMGGTLLLSIFLRVLGVSLSGDGETALIAIIRAGSFLLIYVGCVWRAADALKEGEGIFYAFYVGVLEPLVETLKMFAGSGKK